MPLAHGYIETAELSLPDLPPHMEGMRIAHFSDLHVVRLRNRHHRLVSQFASVRIDLALFTGDYQNFSRDPAPAFELLKRLCGQLRPRLGSFGVFGNHDTPALREACAKLPITWLENTAVQLPAAPIEVMGISSALDTGGDSVGVAVKLAELGRKKNKDGAGRCLRLMLSHYPTRIQTASDLGVDILFTGHTHGGQIRLPTGHAFANSSDLPLRLTAGIMRHRNTLIAVSRGIGNVGPIPRLFCPAHVPVYTLRRLPMHGKYTDEVEMVQAW